jgi:hypothetical protein
VKPTFETKTRSSRASGETEPRPILKSPAKPSKDPPKLREAVFDDYNQLAALHVRNGLTVKFCADWVAQWIGNPAYEQAEGQFPIGWVLETEAGEIVGLIGNIPFACHFRGRDILAAAACAWVVDPRYRRYSMLLLDCLMNQKQTDLVLSTTVSANSEPVLKLFEWSKAPSGRWDQSTFWITNYRGFVKSVLNLKSVPLAGPLSYPVSAALFCRDLFKRRWRSPGDSRFELELCTGFDRRFDDFWEELKRDKHDVLLPHRNRETLAWHFRSALMQRRCWILTASEGARLVAYAIFDRQDNAAWGLKRIRLVDFQALNGSENVLSSAIGWMLRKCREERIHTLENVGCWLDRPGLPKLNAPHHRTLSSTVYYYKAIDKELSETLKDPAVWAPTTFDGDASL